MKFYTENNNIKKLFVERLGFESATIADADMVIFQGGADVTPELYNEKRIPETSCSRQVDESDISLYKSFENKIKIGICRGSQFLNVMNGGKLWQHVNNHAIHGTHQAFDGNEYIEVTSTHHQMMRPTAESIILLTATESTYKLNDKGKFKEVVDIEACYYPETNSFCFQPHPEFNIYSSTADWFCNKLKEVFNWN